MKKFIIIFLLFLLFMAPVTANAEVHPSGKIIKKIYATPDDMILDFIKPKVDMLIHKEYGKPMDWHWAKITKVNHIVDSSGKPKRWYELTTMIYIQDLYSSNNSYDLDSMTFIFTPCLSIKNIRTEDLGDIDFRLLEYKHLTSQPQTKH